MSEKIIQELKKQYPAEFKSYEKGLFKKNIEDVQEGLEVLLSIKGITQNKSDEG